MNGWSRLPCPLKENSSVELTSDKKNAKQNSNTRIFSNKSKQTTWAQKEPRFGSHWFRKSRSDKKKYITIHLQIQKLPLENKTAQ